ncbi:hypothetical protein BKA81DRAFT_343652 [Phyllosticta paracitricarpa]
MAVTRNRRLREPCDRPRQHNRGLVPTDTGRCEERPDAHLFAAHGVVGRFYKKRGGPVETR